jgi:hypothetical protein
MEPLTRPVSFSELRCSSFTLETPNLRKQSRRVIAAPENSEEFRIAMDELHAALKMSVTRGREKIAAMQRGVPRPKD